jgi:hypothetical protein
MKLAAASHRKLELFFREYLDDENLRLPKTHFYVGGFTKTLTKIISVHGITIGRRVFIKPTLLSLNRNNLPKLPEDLIAHEITHVLQYRREGFLKFFYKYLTSYWRNLRAKKKWDAVSRHKAYLEIPYEIEARQAAARFVEWNSCQGKRKKEKGKSEELS